MSTAKLVTRIVHMVFYLNWIVFINRPSRIFMVLDDNLAGQSVTCGCFKSFKRQIVWVTSSQFSLSPARVFSRILYRWRISVHFEFLPQKSLIRYTERDRMEFNTSSCLAVLSSWNLESLNSIWSSPWYFPIIFMVLLSDIMYHTNKVVVSWYQCMIVWWFYDELCTS